jgi:hypothetical protein
MGSRPNEGQGNSQIAYATICRLPLMSHLNAAVHPVGGELVVAKTGWLSIRSSATLLSELAPPPVARSPGRQLAVTFSLCPTVLLNVCTFCLTMILEGRPSDPRSMSAAVSDLSATFAPVTAPAAMSFPPHGSLPAIFFATIRFTFLALTALLLARDPASAVPANATTRASIEITRAGEGRVKAPTSILPVRAK